MPRSAKLPAVVYAWVRSDRPQDSSLIDDYARMCRFVITRRFVDRAGSRPGRQLQAMLAYLRQNSRCRVLLVEKTYGVYRELLRDVDGAALLQRGLQVHVVRENVVVFVSTAPRRKFIRQVAGHMRRSALR